MTAKYVNSSGHTGQSASVIFKTVPLPASIQIGNLLIATIMLNASTSGWTASSGWTLGGPTTGSANWAWKVAVGGDVACTFSWSTSLVCDSNCHQFANATATPIGASRFTTGSSATLAVAAITTTANDSLIFFDSFVQAGAGSPIPLPTGYTNAYSESSAAFPETAAYEKVAISGTNSDGVSITVPNANWMGLLVEIKSGVPTWVSQDAPTPVSAATSISLPMPASLVAGNLLLMFVQKTSAGGAFNAPSANTWNVGGTTADNSARWWWRYVTGTEGSETVSWATSDNAVGKILQYKYVDPSSPIGVSAVNEGSGTTLSIPSITTARPNSEVIDYLMVANSQTIPTVTGWNDFNHSANTQGSWRWAQIDEPLASTAAPATSVTITSAAWAAFQIELCSGAQPSESGVIVQTLKLVKQSASGWGEILGTAAQTLKLITQHALGSGASVFGPIVQTLKLVTQSVTGTMWFKGPIIQTLKLITQSAAGLLVQADGTITQRLKLVQQSATGWQTIFGTAVQTLKRVTQAAGGWAEIIGGVVQMLKLVKQDLIAAEVTLSILYFATLDQLNRARASVEKQIKSTFHGPPDDPLPPMTS